MRGGRLDDRERGADHQLEALVRRVDSQEAEGFRST